MTFYRFSYMIVYALTKLLFRVQVVGRENIPHNDGFIVCSNHRSNYDPIFVGTSLAPYRLYFMAKEELFNVPMVGFIIKKLGAFPIRRGKNDMHALDHAEQLIRDKKALMIFIEGTRSKTGELLRPKSGAVVVASKTAADILPVSLYWQGKLCPFKKVTVRIGKIITQQELGVEGMSKTSIRGASEKVMGQIRMLLEGGHS